MRSRHDLPLTSFARLRLLYFGVGIAFVIQWLVVPAVEMVWATRNSSGTYSLPAGNPVVSGTTISSTWANNTLNDLKTEMTDSLSRSGNGAMLAQLEGYAGTLGTPGYSFDGDADTGLFRNASNDVRFGVDGTYVQKWTSTGVTFPVAATCSAGVTVTQSTADTAGIIVTGNGTAAGATITGGSTSGRGATLLGGAPNGHGLVSTGDGTGEGGVLTGGDSDGNGIEATGGASNGHGGVFTGTGTGNAIRAGTGHVKLTGSNPASTTGFTNTLAPSNIIKAWADLSSDGAALTVANGFNIASVAANGNTFELNFADDFAAATYAAFITPVSGMYQARITTRAAGTLTVSCGDAAGSAIDCNDFSWTVIAIGAQ